MHHFTHLLPLQLLSQCPTPFRLLTSSLIIITCVYNACINIQPAGSIQCCSYVHVFSVSLLGLADRSGAHEDVGCDLSMAFLFEGASKDPASGSASAKHRGCIHCVPVNLCGRCFQTLEVSYILSLSLSPLSPHPSLSLFLLLWVGIWIYDPRSCVYVYQHMCSQLYVHVCMCVPMVARMKLMLGVFHDHCHFNVLRHLLLNPVLTNSG